MNEGSQTALGAGGHWRNWVGNQSFVARHKGEPRSEDELAALVHEASRRNLGVRVVGSGHSFTPVVATSGLLLSLKNMQGVIGVDRERRRVTVRAGTKIGDIGRALKPLGLSLRNQGDIDTQAIAGALSTGTHGTGVTLGNLSSQAVGMRIVIADGAVLEIDGDKDPEMLAAAQVSVGMLGVISAITLQTVDAYNLKERLWRDDFEACMEKHDELAANNRHFSFFWCPVPESRHLYCLPDVSAASPTKRESDVCEMKVMNIADEAPYANETTFERVAYSSEIYPIEYVPNFHELEYAIPVECGKEALRRVRGADADQTYPLHLSRRISLHRGRSRDAEPVLSQGQRDGLGLGRTGRRLLGLSARCRRDPAGLQGAAALGQIAFQHGRGHAGALSAVRGFPSDPPPSRSAGAFLERSFAELVRVAAGLG